MAALEKLPTLTAYQIARLNGKVSHLAGFPMEQLSKNEVIVIIIFVEGV